MTSIRVATPTESLELPAASAPALGLKVWPPEALEATLEAHAKRNRIKLHPGEAYTWTGQVKALKGKRGPRKGQHPRSRPNRHGPIQCREGILRYRKGGKHGA